MKRLWLALCGVLIAGAAAFSAWPISAGAANIGTFTLQNGGGSIRASGGSSNYWSGALTLNFNSADNAYDASFNCSSGASGSASLGNLQAAGANYTGTLNESCSGTIVGPQNETFNNVPVAGNGVKTKGTKENYYFTSTTSIWANGGQWGTQTVVFTWTPSNGDFESNTASSICGGQATGPTDSLTLKSQTASGGYYPATLSVSCGSSIIGQKNVTSNVSVLANGITPSGEKYGFTSNNNIHATGGQWGGGVDFGWNATDGGYENAGGIACALGNTIAIIQNFNPATGTAASYTAQLSVTCDTNTTTTSIVVTGNGFAPNKSATQTYTLTDGVTIHAAGGVFGASGVDFSYDPSTKTATGSEQIAILSENWTITGITQDTADKNYTGTITAGTGASSSINGKIKILNPNGITLGTPPPPGGSGTVDCTAGSLTWFMCPIISASIDIVDGIRDAILVPFLQEQPLTTKLKNGQDNPEYKIWDAFRNVASVMLILVFFIIIFGTALGMDNYSVKKILPHLVAGAILLPLSWYICAIGIDIGNILGQGLLTLANGFIPAPHIDFTSDLSQIFAYGGAVVVGLAVISLAHSAVAEIGLGVIVTILIFVLVTMFTLILRQILITLLVVISPFAVLAWILPNTSKLFTKWWQNLLRMILVYPLIMMLFEAGRIFSYTAGITYSAGSGTASDIATAAVPFLQLAGLYLPLLAVPFAFSWAGGIMKLGSNAIAKAGDRLDSRYGKNSAGNKERLQRRQNKNASRAETAGNVFGRNWNRVRSGTGGFILPQTVANRQKQIAMAHQNDALEQVKGRIKGEQDLRAKAAGKGIVAPGPGATKKETKQYKKQIEARDVARGQLKTLGTGARRDAYQEAGRQSFITEHAAIEAGAKVRERTNTDLSQQMANRTAAQAAGLFKQRTVESGYTKVTRKDGTVAAINQLNPITDRSLMEKERNSQMKQLASGQGGDEALVAAYGQSIAKTGGGVNSNIRAAVKYLGSTYATGPAPEHRELYDEMFANVNKDAHPSTQSPSIAADDSVSAEALANMHPKAQEQYLSNISDTSKDKEFEKHQKEAIYSFIQAMNAPTTKSKFKTEKLAAAHRLIDDPGLRAQFQAIAQGDFAKYEKDIKDAIDAQGYYTRVDPLTGAPLETKDASIKREDLAGPTAEDTKDEEAYQGYLDRVESYYKYFGDRLSQSDQDRLTELRAQHGTPTTPPPGGGPAPFI